jgi:adenylyltransferase/sulfurtransferase
MSLDPSESEEISARELSGMREKKSAFTLIDCRESDEWNFNRIEGARHFPLSRMPEIAPHLLSLAGPDLVIYCHHGIRSLHVTRWLREHGISNVFSLAGGISAWSRDVDPTIPEY